MIAFEKVDSIKASFLLSEILPYAHGALPLERECDVLVRSLPFFPDYTQIDIISNSSHVGPTRWSALHRKGEVIMADGQASTIYALAKRMSLCLEPLHVLDYARFFFSWVRGPHGRFFLIEGPEDLSWISDNMSVARREIARLITPFAFKGQDSQTKDFHAMACLLVTKNLFSVHIHITSEGILTLKDQVLLAQNLPVQDEALCDFWYIFLRIHSTKLPCCVITQETLVLRAPQKSAYTLVAQKWDHTQNLYFLAEVRWVHHLCSLQTLVHLYLVKPGPRRRKRLRSYLSYVLGYFLSYGHF